MNKRAEEVVGFDIGHGETALARVTLRAGETPQIIRINGRSSQITAVGRLPGTGIIVGEQALRSRNVLEAQVGFKLRPPGTEDSREALVEFASYYNSLMVTTGQILGGERTHYYVGCPTAWTREEVELYRNLLATVLPVVTVVPESRAALMQAKAAREREIELQDWTVPILVIDLGSSTIDVTYIRGGIHDESLDLGVELGAHLIEKEILRRAIECHAKRGEIETFFASQEGAAYRKGCELACRELKEKYWSDESVNSSEGCQTLLPVGETGYILKAFIDANEMQAILSTPLDALAGGSWGDKFRSFLEYVRSALDARSVTPSVFILTGGPSFMSFVRTLCANTFPHSRFVWCTPPEETVAMGLARWGAVQLQTTAFSEEVRLLCENDLPAVVRRHMTTLRESLVRELATSIVTDIVIPAVREWRDGNPTTLNLLSESVVGRATEWLKSRSATSAMERGYRPILIDIAREVDALTFEICKKHDIPHGSLALTVSVSLDPQLGFHMETPLDSIMRAVQVATGGVALVFLAMAHGTLATATLANPPLLWPVLAMWTALGALFGAVSIQSVLRDTNLPVGLRRTLVSEERLTKVIHDTVPTVRDSLTAALTDVEMEKISTTIISQVAEFLSARANEIKWIIDDSHNKSAMDNR